MSRPSWQDFGTHDESAYPELWDGVVGAWCPSLGQTGLRLLLDQVFMPGVSSTNWAPLPPAI